MALTCLLKCLEELEQKPNQSQAEFMEDLKTLEQLCRHIPSRVKGILI